MQPGQEVDKNPSKGLNAALFALKSDLAPIVKGQDNPFFRSSYADINEILKVVEPLAAKHGLLITQPIETDGNTNVVRTYITHVESGKMLASGLSISSGLLKPQDIGSAITYYRRYTLQSLLGLQAVDDDGNLASGKTKRKVSKKSAPASNNDDF